MHGRSQADLILPHGMPQAVDMNTAAEAVIAPPGLPLSFSAHCLLPASYFTIDSNPNQTNAKGNSRAETLLIRFLVLSPLVATAPDFATAAEVKPIPKMTRAHLRRSWSDLSFQPAQVALRPYCDPPCGQSICTTHLS